MPQIVLMPESSLATAVADPSLCVFVFLRAAYYANGSAVLPQGTPSRYACRLLGFHASFPTSFLGLVFLCGGPDAGTPPSGSPWAEVGRTTGIPGARALVERLPANATRARYRLVVMEKASEAAYVKEPWLGRGREGKWGEDRGGEYEG